MASKKIEVEILADAAKYSSSLKRASSVTSTFGSRLGSVAKYAGLALGATALGGLALVLKKGTDEFTQHAKVSAQTTAALKSTGDAAGVTKKHIEDLANAVLRKTGIDDEAVQTTENLLLSFTNLRNEAGKGNDVFDRATRLVEDYSVRTGKSATGAVTIFGKALNDIGEGKIPTTIRGIGHLNDELVKHITAMQKAGDTTGAQSLLLTELEKRYKGAAEAAGDTLPGKLDILKESLNNLAGDLVARMAPSITNFVDSFTKHLPQIEAVASSVFGALGKGITALAGTFERNWPRIKAAGKIVSDWYDENLRPTMISVFDNLEKLFEKLTGNVKTHTDRMGRELDSSGNRMEADTRGHTTAIEGFYKKMFANLVAFTNAGLALLRGDWNTAWEQLKKGVVGNVTALLDLLKSFWSKAFEIAKQLGSEVVDGVVAGVTSLASKVGGSIWGAIKGGIDAAKRKAGIKSPSTLTRDEIGKPIAEGVIVGWLEGTASLPSKVAQKIQDAIEAGRRAIDAKRTVFSTAFGRLTSGIFTAFDAETAAHQTPAEKLIADIGDRRQMEDLQKALADAITGGDPQAILRAQEDIQLVALQKQADAERQNYESRRANLRQSLEDRLNMIESHFEKEGGKVGDLTKDITTTLKKFGIDFAGAGEELGAAFVSGLKTAIAKAGKGAGAISSTITNLANAIPNVGKATPLAAGGIVSSPTLALVGESGPEAVIPLSQYRRGGGGDTYNVTVNGAVGSPTDIAQLIRRELLRVSARNGSVGLA